MNIMYFNAVKVIYVGRGCIFLLVDDGYCTMRVILHSNNLYFTTWPIHNILHYHVWGISVFYISTVLVSRGVFSHCVVLNGPFGLLDNCTGCKGI